MALKPPEVRHLAGRDAALREFGFRPHEAAWLTLVCLHSGVFTRTQFTEHHRCHRKKTSRFLRALTERGFAREHPVPGVGTRLRYTHVHSRSLYSALGVEDTRHRRKPEEDVVLFRRLLSLDHVVRHPRLPWLATEAEKVAHFEARGIPRNHYPSRIYGGAAKRTRRYFPLRLPIAADLRSATFVYADPGRHTDTELRSWAGGHRHLWPWLRVFGTKVHVAVVTRTVPKQHQLSRRVAAWASPPVRPLTPEEWQTVVAVRAALLSADPAALEQWGGFHAARRVLIRLRQRGAPEAAGRTSGPAIDGYSTHHARGLAPQVLA